VTWCRRRCRSVPLIASLRRLAAPTQCHSSSGSRSLNPRQDQRAGLRDRVVEDQIAADLAPWEAAGVGLRAPKPAWRAARSPYEFDRASRPCSELMGDFPLRACTLPDASSRAAAPILPRSCQRVRRQVTRKAPREVPRLRSPSQFSFPTQPPSQVRRKVRHSWNGRKRAAKLPLPNSPGEASNDTVECQQ
jgi:hypothetical protein